MNKLRKKAMVSTSRSTKMTRVVMLGLLMSLPLTSVAQRLLTLDSCRAMALRNNKQRQPAEVGTYAVSAEGECCRRVHVDEP